MIGLPPELPYELLEPLLVDATVRLQRDLDATGVDARVVLLPHGSDHRWRYVFLRPVRDAESVTQSQLVMSSGEQTYIGTRGAWTRFHDADQVLPMLTVMVIRDIWATGLRRRWPRCRGRRHLMSLDCNSGQCHWVCRRSGERVRVGDLDLRVGHGERPPAQS